jgi:Protein of unknown function (DUF2634)
VSNLVPEPDADAVPSLLPIQEQPLPADDAFRRFEEALDQRPDSDDLVVTQEPPLPVGRSWAFDFERKAFERAPGQTGPVEIRGDDALRQWIETTLRTARGAHPIYSDDYGIDMPADFIGGTASSFPLDVYEDAVTEALLVHRQIASVEDFDVLYDPEQEYVGVSFTLIKASTDDDSEESLRIESARLLG